MAPHALRCDPNHLDVGTVSWGDVEEAVHALEEGLDTLSLGGVEGIHLPPQASWKTRIENTTLSAAATHSVRSGWRLCEEPGSDGVWKEGVHLGVLGTCRALRHNFLPSYEFMRRSLIFYRSEIQKMTGKVDVGT